VNWANRRPATATTEARYAIFVVCDPDHVSDMRDPIEEELARANYPLREVETVSKSDDQIELEAILVPITADTAELGAVVAALERSPLVRSATWTAQSTA
jgi:putative Mg2+ transporter-C (MgtC) family protein